MSDLLFELNIYSFFKSCFHKNSQKTFLLSVFLFSILGMGAGSFELGKFTSKVEKWEKCNKFSQVTILSLRKTF